MKKNSKGFSIIIWMWLTLLITLSAYVILWYIVPYAKNIKWIENTTNAYYNAYSWIEKSLYHTKTRLTTSWQDLTTETWAIIWNNSIWYEYKTYSSWNTIPLSWVNQLSMFEPIQLEVWYNKLNSFSGNFKIPADLCSSCTLDWWTWAIINWILSSENDTLFASWSYITADQITSSWLSSWDIKDKNGINFWWSWMIFNSFYDSNCWTNSWCILKMSVVNNLTVSNNPIPYLEYKIDFWSSVPLRYTIIKTTWKSYWFKKNLEVKVPQQTINQAFDFTVFQ